ncbi:MAG: carboxypeptidase-like regulatory domain-containing protein [Planctomycetaceae bacterium]|nr:carboxypeptidase-like regulatory domain-containing protein [Planctomycetaceae bacterium]
MKKYAGIGVCLLLLVTMHGCGSVDAEFRPVSGIVTYDGTLLEGASVAFVPVDNSGVAATGTTDATGKYTLTSTTAKKFGTGAKPGKYLVKISKTEASVNPD